jgi:hypothetical protein
MCDIHSNGDASGHLQRKKVLMILYLIISGGREK